jgi:hypothetical protein
MLVGIFSDYFQGYRVTFLLLCVFPYKVPFFPLQLFAFEFEAEVHGLPLILFSPILSQDFRSKEDVHRTPLETISLPS